MTTIAEYQQSYLDERREYWMAMLDAPYPTRRGEDCRGRHGGGWDWFVWRGEDYRSERAYCGHCGQVCRGEVSPWNEAALADWYATPYMQHLRTEMQRRCRRAAIKRYAAGRRTTREI